MSIVAEVEKALGDIHEGTTREQVREALKLVWQRCVHEELQAGNYGRHRDRSAWANVAAVIEAAGLMAKAVLK